MRECLTILSQCGTNLQEIAVTFSSFGEKPHPIKMRRPGWTGGQVTSLSFGRSFISSHVYSVVHSPDRSIAHYSAFKKKCVEC